VSGVLVVGAGLSGLATAWYLVEAGAEVEVVEAADRPGGLIRTIATPHGLVETAANAFVRSPRVDALFTALDLPACSPLPSSRRRYILRDGRPRRWPLTPVESVATAARFVGAWVTRQHRARDGETVGSWGRRVLGEAAIERLVGPALHGIYASPPDALSARAVAASRPTGRREMVAPSGGMGQLIDHLHAALTRRGVRITLQTPMTPARLDPSRRTVIATDAASAARLLAPHAPEFAAAAARIRRAPVSPVTAFFEPSPDDLHGFGVLFPRAEGRAALGVRFDADAFPDRGSGRVETWIFASAAGVAPLTNALRADRRALTGIDAAPLAVYATIWPEAIPIYDDAVVAIAALRASLPPWLAVAGNYLGKIGVAGLLDVAASAASRTLNP
jgi:oxygen-dependent protoporphyrinogen oxidase